MRGIESLEFSRNYGFWSEDEQIALMRSTVAIGGVGGDGFHLGLRLAAMGVARFDVADPEVFERENVNRVPGANESTYGRKKVDVFAEMVRNINPDADIRVFSDGVTSDNVEDFVSRADLVYDETELTHLDIGTVIARTARQRGIPDVMVMNIGFAGQVTSFHPNSRRHTFESFMGIPKGMPLDEVREQKLKLDHCVPYLPPYADLETLKAVENGADLPSIAQGVDIAAALGASQGFLHLVGPVNNKRPKPIWAPRVRFMDSLSGEAKTTRFPKISHYRYLTEMVLRNTMGVNPLGGYSEENRARRAGMRTLEH